MWCHKQKVLRNEHPDAGGEIATVWKKPLMESRDNIIWAGLWDLEQLVTVFIQDHKIICFL